MVADEETQCAEVFDAPDAKEAMQAFLQKRTPRFQDL